jgi:starch synthase (maltosyl-transferring)
MDLVVNHTSKDSELAASHPGWFARDHRGEFVSPSVTDPADPTRKTVWADLAELDYRPPQQHQILAYFQQLVRHYVGLGFDGFRCDAAYKVPAEVWRGLIAAAKATSADVIFCAETVGAPLEAVLALAEAGFDYLYNSVKWWDFESPWLLEQYEAFRHIAPSIGFPESHDTKRLAAELLTAGIPEAAIEPHYRQAYAFAASYSTGVMMPMGFEFGWSRALDVVTTRTDEPEPKRFDLSAFVTEVNAMKKAIPALNEEGPQRLLSNRDDPLVVLERQTESGEERAFVLVNSTRIWTKVLRSSTCRHSVIQSALTGQAGPGSQSSLSKCVSCGAPAFTRRETLGSLIPELRESKWRVASPVRDCTRCGGPRRGLPSRMFIPSSRAVAIRSNGFSATSSKFERTSFATGTTSCALS